MRSMNEININPIYVCDSGTLGRPERLNSHFPIIHSNLHGQFSGLTLLLGLTCPSGGKKSEEAVYKSDNQSTDCATKDAVIFRRDRDGWSVHMRLWVFLLGWACFIGGGLAIQIVLLVARKWGAE